MVCSLVLGDQRYSVGMVPSASETEVLRYCCVHHIIPLRDSILEDVFFTSSRPMPVRNVMANTINPAAHQICDQCHGADPWSLRSPR